MLNLDTDYEVRQEVIWALAQIGGEDVIERLERFANMTDDEDEIDLIEDSLEYLELFGADDPELAAFLADPRLGQEFFEDDDDFEDFDDEEEDFFKIPMDTEEWARYVDDDDSFDDDEDDEFGENYDEDEEDF